MNILWMKFLESRHSFVMFNQNLLILPSTTKSLRINFRIIQVNLIKKKGKKSLHGSKRMIAMKSSSSSSLVIRVWRGDTSLSRINFPTFCTTCWNLYCYCYCSCLTGSLTEHYLHETCKQSLFLIHTNKVDISVFHFWHDSDSDFSVEY